MVVDRWLTSAELALALKKRLGAVHVETVRKWTKKGCPHRLDRNGHRRFLLDEVIRWYLPESCPAAS
jgi:phage terminase Nu1 subunit (DNA packaging protein)